MFGAIAATHRIENESDYSLTLEATEIPDPPTPGPGQIQVEVRAFPLHPGDLVGVSFGPPHPGQRTVPGLEATGVVVATGPGVDTPTVGTRETVFPNPGPGRSASTSLLKSLCPYRPLSATTSPRRWSATR